jgi:hypothetical protein
MHTWYIHCGYYAQWFHAKYMTCTIKKYNAEVTISNTKRRKTEWRWYFYWYNVQKFQRSQWNPQFPLLDNTSLDSEILAQKKAEDSSKQMTKSQWLSHPNYKKLYAELYTIFSETIPYLGLTVKPIKLNTGLLKTLGIFKGKC